jgi:hypothetical protein
LALTGKSLKGRDIVRAGIARGVLLDSERGVDILRKY